MSFIAKSPMTATKLKTSPPSPIEGTRGLFSMEDGWYDIDDKGNVNRIPTEKEIDEKIKDINISGIDLSKYDLATLQAMYNEVLEPSPEHWFVFDEENKAITGLNTEYEAEYSDASITDLVFPFQINGVTVETVGKYSIDFNESPSFLLSSNIENVRLPNCIKMIDELAFQDNYYLKTINIPTSCSYIGRRVFGDCKSLENIITPIKPNYELVIKQGVFFNCEKLNNIDTIIDGVKEILFGCFTGTSIEHVIIPESVNLIEHTVFGEFLKTITILNPKCDIDEYCFMSVPEGLIIKGYKGSTAETWATNKGVPFIALDEEVYSKEEVDEKIANIDIPDVDLSDYIPTPETAEIGQTIVVKEVDENGKPIRWESADVSTGVKKWDLLGEYTFTEDAPVSAVTLRDLPNYTEFMIYANGLYTSVNGADVSAYINGKRAGGGNNGDNGYWRMHVYLCDCWHADKTPSRTAIISQGLALETSNNGTGDTNPATVLIIKNQYNASTFKKGTMVIYGGK